MNSADLSKILEEHKVWITSMHESGSRADLRGADLRDANLRDANLCDADLRDANLRDANLRDANLRDANLCGADLRGANLCGADLRGANLCGADLRDANLCGADLRDANLRDANLCGADLRGANLCGADLPDLTFVILGEKYFISITNGEYVRAGCQNHTVEEWRKYSKQEIAEMDGRKALKFYPRLLDIIDFYIGKGERPDWLASKEYADEVTE
ncbi:pentapeptide repeat-containing protein [Salmonella enterica]|uniref:pentapeptide repeat-containing protein n=1 Tax=Salmonella enterica TaxID=28901 RepID=UPI000D586C50|nr:pentapeptide repeat-containing protein [Salmonella enterica]EGH2859806.1 pentapeptide repeat-containing protein [Salmonella enterica]PVQ71820.1 pentapeptide repeat-containing protein [Salmonella enterica subsp. enterica serovar Anatum]PVS82125.1 pentapeptide repeat-containing protein [Salmonella enterica subsp. enterica serovar Anatum]